MEQNNVYQKTEEIQIQDPLLSPGLNLLTEEGDGIELRERMDLELVKAAKGCIMGAFIGDSAGAVLEFFSGKIERKDVEEAFQFGGGGAMDVGPGQFTDDSEMALCLMRGILASGDCELNQDKLATEYLRWYNSSPFDIGFTTGRAMRCIRNHFLKYKEKDHLDLLIREIRKVNYQSDSNGCLMRATPLSVY